MTKDMTGYTGSEDEGSMFLRCVVSTYKSRLRDNRGEQYRQSVNTAKVSSELHPVMCFGLRYFVRTKRSNSKLTTGFNSQFLAGTKIIVAR
jgi:hypothetical protein